MVNDKDFYPPERVTDEAILPGITVSYDILTPRTKPLGPRNVNFSGPDLCVSCRAVPPEVTLCTTDYMRVCRTCASQQRQTANMVYTAGGHAWPRPQREYLPKQLSAGVRDMLFCMSVGTEFTGSGWTAFQLEGSRGYTVPSLGTLFLATARGYLTLQTAPTGVKEAVWVRTAKACKRPAPEKNTSALPWNAVEHRKLVKTVGTLAWLGLHPDYQGITAEEAVTVVRDVAGNLLQQRPMSWSRRYSYRYLLVTAEPFRTLCALALVDPVFHDGKLIRVDPLSPEQAAERTQALIWPGMLSNLL